MFDVGLPELVVLVVAALFVFGPERLPSIAAQAARMLRDLRGMAAGVRREIGDVVGPDLAELGSLTNLDPRRAVTRTLLDADADADAGLDAGTGRDAGTGAARPPRARSGPAATSPAASTPPTASTASQPPAPAFDPDAT